MSIQRWAALATAALVLGAAGCKSDQRPSPGSRGVTLVGIEVSPAAATVAVGGSRLFTVSGQYSDGARRPISESVSWSSSAPAIATIDASGVARGVAEGSAQIRAQVGALSDTSLLTVVAAGGGDDGGGTDGGGGDDGSGDDGGGDDGGVLPNPSKVKVGVGVADMTPDVGYCAGQYCSENTAIFDELTGSEIDPYGTHKTKAKSYGVQSRLTARAIVIEGENGKRIALLKTDNYLAQDNLLRRVGQILDEGDSGISYDQILHHVTHNHSAAYSSTLSWGVWVFEDVYDARFFENQARKMAEAIESAAADMRPARMGATQIRHKIYKGNVVRLATADDGTPAGYPLEYGDQGLVVMRFDEVDDYGEYVRPIAVWANWGEHPESLDGYDLHSADFLGPLERFVDRALGVPLVFSQADVGSAENTGNGNQRLEDDGDVCGTRADASLCPFGEGVLRDWNHKGFVQTERNVRYLADDIVRAFNAIQDGDAVIPYTTAFPVDYVNAWVPGPLSHPYPSVSNCRSETTAEGNAGVPVAGLPDCAREGNEIGASPELWAGLEDLGELAGLPVGERVLLWETLKAENVPLPEHYDFPAFGAVEENLRLRLQAFRIGDALLASCACEAQVDLILNIESRIDAAAGNIYDGFDWACLLPAYAADEQYAQACARQTQYFDPAEYPTGVPGTDEAKADAAKIARMRAQVHNDARGWDAPENAVAANTEPADVAAIWGNFTKEEIQDIGAPGYKLAVGIGHAGDYNGYTVSYREYMNRDSYRKALTAYGPHTGDYMATRLVRMAAQLQGGAALAAEPHDVLAQVDEARQLALATIHGQVTAAAFDAWNEGIPDDVGPAEPLAQPAHVERFRAAHFTWRGGSTAIDNPAVMVERCTLYPQPCALDTDWETFADQTGEVATRVRFPTGLPGAVEAYGSQFSWEWTAAFEAYSAFPARMGSTPPGQYRFSVQGRIRQGGATSAYAFRSDPFEVLPFAGLEVTAPARNAGDVTFSVPAIVYPRSYESSPFPFIHISGDDAICDNCSFRPWAERGRFDHAVVQVGDAEIPATCVIAPDGSASCTADTNLADGQAAHIVVYDTDGNVGTVPVP